MPSINSDTTHVSASEEEDEIPLVDGNIEQNNEIPLVDWNVEQDCPPVTRKRTVNEKLWKKNVRKTKKLSGDSYSSAITGKIIPCKTFVPIVCKCIKKCHNFIPELNQKEIFTKFYELASYDLQTKVVKKKNIHKKCRYF